MGVDLSGSGIIVMEGINKYMSWWLNTEMKLGIQLIEVLELGELKNSLSWCCNADVPLFLLETCVPHGLCDS